MARKTAKSSREGKSGNTGVVESGTNTMGTRASSTKPRATVHFQLDSVKADNNDGVGNGAARKQRCPKKVTLRCQPELEPETGELDDGEFTFSFSFC